MAIDLGGQFYQNQGPKSGNQQVHPTGDIQEARSRRRWARFPSFADNLVEPRALIRREAPYSPSGAQFCL